MSIKVLNSKKMNSELLVKQNIYLKNQYSLALFSLLSQYHLPIELVK
jgi:hypothetical protein